MADRRPTILHVDDDEANRYAVTRSLVKAGFDVTEAADGATALAQLADHPDLVILDVRLPDINGFEVCRRIKADPATAAIPVLHLSASLVSGTAKAQGLDGGADGYLIRPVEPVELIATVNALLRTKRVEAELRASQERLREALDTAQRARAEAEQAGRMKDEFLANLSHELRTPLNAILGWATILASDAPPEPADLRDGLETIRRNARAQTRIIEDLLDMSRIIGGKVRLDVRPTDLAAVVREATDTVRPAADAKGVAIDVRVDPALGPIGADPDRIQQVLWNLLSNAIKFTPRGGQVGVAVRHLQSHLDLTVTDTGQGIPAAFLPYVFDRFRQVDGSTTRRHGGLGLGLAISKQLVELHGGTIGVNSPGEGQGTTFRVTLPLTPVASDPSPPAQPGRAPAAPTDAAADLTGIRILVIDDEPDAREMVRRVLEGCGATVTTADSADDAVGLARAEPFEALVSDIGLPGEDGYSLIRRVRGLLPAENATVPALALTAYARQADAVRSIAAGYQGHLTKPVEPTTLIAAVAALVGR